MSNHSRRAVVAGIAAAPTLAAPALALNEPDPIFASERSKEQAEEDWYQRNGMAELKAAAGTATIAEERALLALLTIRPTTIAGMAALLDYATAHSGENGEREGTDIFDHEAINKAGEGFYRHLAYSLRTIGAVS
jgi:hypothetical protein